MFWVRAPCSTVWHKTKIPHSEMRPGYWLKLFHVLRWDNVIGQDTGWAPPLQVPFHSLPADWGGEAEWKSEIKCDFYLSSDWWTGNKENWRRKHAKQPTTCIYTPVSCHKDGKWVIKSYVVKVYYRFNIRSVCIERKWDFSTLKALRSHSVNLDTVNNAVNAFKQCGRNRCWCIDTLVTTPMHQTCATAALTGWGAKKERAQVVIVDWCLQLRDTVCRKDGWT